MKPTLVLVLAALALLAACEAIPTAAEQECRDHQRLHVGSAEYNDCVAKLKSSEHQLRQAE